MSEKGSEPLREFHPVDPADAHKVLKEAVRTLAAAMIWTKEQKHVLNSNIRAYDGADATFYAWVPTGVDPSEFMKELEKLGSADCFFSISLARANIFFKATCTGYDSGGFRFAAPAKIYKVQRRKDIRLMIPFGHVVKVEIVDPMFPDQKLTKKVFDISAGGLALIIDDAEAAIFTEGLRIKVSFAIRTRKITAEAEIRHIKAQPSGSSNPGMKLGLQFVKIDDGDKAWISAYVFEESRKYLSKYL